jgi:hypothetical protein
VQFLRLNATCISLGFEPEADAQNETAPSWQKLHNALYGSFSRVQRIASDEARTLIADSSIDLLHFGTNADCPLSEKLVDEWLPKMSPAGVILLQLDSLALADGKSWLGWEQLKARFPHFELGGNENLGLVGVGDALPEALKALLTLSPEDSLTLRTMLFQLGRAANVADERVGKKLIAGGVEQGQSPSPADERMKALEQTIREQSEHIDSLKAHLQVLGGREAELRLRFLEAHSQLNDRDDALLLLSRERKIIAERDEGIAWLKSELALAQTEIKQMKNTRAWRASELYRQWRNKLRTGTPPASQG